MPAFMSYRYSYLQNVFETPPSTGRIKEWVTADSFNVKLFCN